MKRVLIIGKLPPPYIGPAIATKILLDSALNKEFELLHFNSTLNKSIQTQGKLSVYKAFLNLGLYLRYFKMLLKYKPDLVLVPISQTRIGFIKDAVYIIFASFFSKVLIQLRGSNIRNWIDNEIPIMKWFVARILHRASGVIVLGENLRYLFESYFNPNRIFVVPNGGNFQVVHSKVERTKTKIFYLGNLFSSKGVIDVVESAMLLPEITQCEYQLLGGWQEPEVQKYCLDLIDKHKLPITVINPSESDNKLEYLSSSDIFLFPPRDPEGHPWVIVEAMAAGLPIISTDRGAIIESVRDNQNGYIVQAASPDQIAERISFLVNNPDIRKAMGKESRKLYEENFTEDKMIARYVDVFNTVITQL